MGCPDDGTAEIFVILYTEYLGDKNYTCIILLQNRRLAVIILVLWHLWKSCFLLWHYKFILAKVAKFLRHEGIYKLFGKDDFLSVKNATQLSIFFHTLLTTIIYHE